MVAFEALKLRPGEWVLVLFVAYALVRMALAHRLGFHAAAFPRQDIAITLLAILTTRLFFEYRKEPWPDPSAGTRHLIALPLFFGPSVLIVVARRALLQGDGETAAIASVVDALRIYLNAAAFAVVPPLFFWLFLGLELKRHGTLGGSRLLASLGRYLGTAARDWLSPMLLIYAYVLMEPVLSQQMVPDQDDRLTAIDRAMFFGHNPNQLCEGIIRPWLSEWLAGAYIFYALLFPIALGVAYVKDQKKFRELAFATTFALAVGYVGYTLVPAQGPLFTMHFDQSLDLYYLREAKVQLMDRLRVARDCFPSLHTCLSLTLFWGLARSSPRIAWPLAPLVLSIPVACVYLRYHYVIDVIAGAVLFGLTAWLTTRIFRDRESA
jgi:membrane-associated phospholipid phosphatase